MRRTNGVTLKINGPDKGLQTKLPPDMEDDGKGQFLTVGTNVRAADGQLSAAPGYERIDTPKRPLETPANLIFQPNITSADAEMQAIPIIGTSTELLTMERRARNLVCPVDCTLRFAATADSGQVGANLAAVANLIRSWSPEVIVHAGDLVYPNSGVSDQDNPYDEEVGRYYWWAIGGYSGPYGKGPSTNRFFSAPGNHDYTDGPESRYLAAMQMPGNGKYYSIKRGPVQFFFIDSYGYGPVAAGPGGDPLAGTGAAIDVGWEDLSSTGPQAQWLQAELAASDCPWRVVVWHHPPQSSEDNYYPGYEVMNWPLGEWGADVLITGHSHVYERIHRADGVLHIITGNGGHSLREFVPTPVTGSQVRYSAKYGAVLVDATATKFILKAYSVDGDLVDSTTRTTTRDIGLCYVGPFSAQADSLKVLPASAAIPVGVAFPLQALATALNGNTSDVTSISAWSSSDTSIATVDGTGRVTGAKTGQVTITASYGGLTASSIIDVLAPCEDRPTDIIMLLDCSGSMAQAFSGASRMARMLEGANLLLDAVHEDDRVSVVSYSTWVTVHNPLTTDISVPRADLAGLFGAGSTFSSAAVQVATNELTDNARPEANKLIVFFTDGFANIDGLTPMADTTAAAAVAKALGYRIVVIGLDLQWDPIKEEEVRAWATCPDMYYSVLTPDEMLSAFVRVRDDVCQDICSSGGPIGIGLI